MPLISVGDVVTYHLITAGHTPAVALTDEQTERAAVDDEIAETIAEHDGFDKTVTAPNPPASLTAELLTSLSTAISEAPTVTTLIEVDGEEDLAALPAILSAPVDATVVYGQPGEGMVCGVVDENRKREVTAILRAMDGDMELFYDVMDRS
nr:GTP-dependent dephospho-CoA kinase family protein [Halovenus rubra]